ncbi:hypothetical protein [Pedobacter arcticus]|uniref:hypothetical protein n=1 Tax=Pedobacter arcticus TaxID=752140 RepID=UPI00031C04E3|nr:hypothetical protein [Pedobacter arcticus]
MYRYRTLILTLLIGTLANIVVSFYGSLLIRTILLETSLLVFFLVLFSKRTDKKETEKNEEHNGVKIYL